MIIVAQTVSADWSISTPNPEEDGCETELAFFHTSATAHGSPARAAMMLAVARTAALLNLKREAIRVQSHDSDARIHMENLVAGAEARMDR